jgi:tRNA dimethylallyltransferase
MAKIIVIVGPTGVGKTKLSINLAKSFNGEIINGDSMQIYKDLNIGTAKIKEEEKEGIKHYLFDIKDVKEDYSVFNYQKDGRAILDDILKRDKTPIIVGGTGLYIKALLYNYKFTEEPKIINNYDHLTNEELYNMLIKINPNNDIHMNNRKRVIRALNYYQNNDTKDNDMGNELLYDAIFIGLTMPREELYDRINKRVDKMLQEGLLEEVKALYDNNIRSKAIMTGIGYKELYQYFDHNISLEEATNLIKRNSRRYAKRQYTWFNNQMDIKWFNVDINDFNNTINEVISYIGK